MEASDTDIHHIFLPTHKDKQSHQLTFLISQAKCLLFFLFSFSLHENVIFDLGCHILPVQFPLHLSRQSLCLEKGPPARGPHKSRLFSYTSPFLELKSPPFCGGDIIFIYLPIDVRSVFILIIRLFILRFFLSLIRFLFFSLVFFLLFFVIIIEEIVVKVIIKIIIQII